MFAANPVVFAAALLKKSTVIHPDAFVAVINPGL